MKELSASNFRTTDIEYGKEYWNTLDGGRGYQTSTMWADIAHTLFELFGWKNGVDITGNLRVIEFGCASGFLIEELRKRNFETFGVDISDYALKMAHPYTQKYLRKFDMSWVDDTHFGRENFDLVVCFETLEHISEDMVLRSLAHIYNCLKPGGKAVLTICTEDQPGWDSDPTHVTIKSRRWWDKRLKLLFIPMQTTLGHLRKFYLFSQHRGVFVLERRDFPLSKEPFDGLGMDLVRGCHVDRPAIRLEPISQGDSQPNVGGGKGLEGSDQTIEVGLDSPTTGGGLSGASFAGGNYEKTPSGGEDYL